MAYEEDYDAEEGELDGFEFEPPAESQAMVIAPKAVEVQILRPEDYELIATPALTIEAMQAKREAMARFIAEMWVPGVDYGQIPGTKGNTMLKPAYEKTITLLGFHVDPSCQESILQRDFVQYRYKASVWKSGIQLGSAERVANSDEPCFCEWYAVDIPEDKAERDRLIELKEIRYNDYKKRYERRLPNAQPRSIAMRIAARAAKRACVEVVRNVTAMTDALLSLPVFDLSKAPKLLASRPAPAAAPHSRQIREATRQDFWDAAKATGIPLNEFNALAAQAQKGEISWAEALSQLPQNK